MRSVQKRKSATWVSRLAVLAAVVVSIAYFFPILYMFITGFKHEAETVPPQFFFSPTLENYQTVLSSEILSHLLNSILVTVSTIIVSLVLGVPAAYALVFGKIRKPESIVFWFLSTTFLPAVAVIIPVFVVFKNLGLLDTHLSLVLMYIGMNVPIVVWMARSFFKDIPVELLEAAGMDGASKTRTFFQIVLPLVRSGLMSTALLVFIFAWNEFFFAINLSYVQASTLPVYMASFMTQEGFFWAKLSAISTITVLPPLILGWISHKSLVRGLFAGAVKG